MHPSKKGKCVKCKKGTNRKLNMQGVCYHECLARQDGGGGQGGGRQSNPNTQPKPNRPANNERNRSKARRSSTDPRDFDTISEASSNPSECGDVECGECAEIVIDETKSMQCESCQHWFHLNPCCNMDEARYDALIDHRLMDIVRWFCKKCDKAVMQANTTGGLEDIRTRLAALEETKNLEKLIEIQVKKYMEEKTETDKRKLNIVVHGIPESPEEIEEEDGETRPSTPAERKQHDLKKLAELKQADNKLEIKEADVESTFRLGAKRDDGKPRTLCVKLRRQDVKKRLLENAKNLRKAPDGWKKSVFINPDLTREERERNYRARQELKRRKDNGEHDLIIRNFQVVKKSTVGSNESA